jgi:bifunctional non-homologous end joining protein LigD
MLHIAPMALTQYKRKRNFTATPEPKGKRKVVAKTKKLLFVVQEHHATQLHFDFRLEMEGVLKSWAVPKGPSLDPKDKRLAMHVEDHPFDYRTFHGTIPEGNYGAGEVRIWDSGWYETVSSKSPIGELREGNLKMILHGKKLKGEFHLIQMHKSGEETTAEHKAWLLFKHKDAFAKSGWKLEPLLHYGSRTQKSKAIGVKKSKTKNSDAKKVVTKKNTTAIVPAKKTVKQSAIRKVLRIKSTSKPTAKKRAPRE